MHTTLTGEEEIAIEALCKKLSEAGFGVTHIEDHLTVRFGINKTDVTVNMRINEIESYNPNWSTCYSCGDQRHDSEMYDSIATIDTCTGTDEQIIKLCYDCYCPK